MERSKQEAFSAFIILMILAFTSFLMNFGRGLLPTSGFPSQIYLAFLVFFAAYILLSVGVGKELRLLVLAGTIGFLVSVFALSVAMQPEIFRTIYAFFWGILLCVGLSLIGFISTMALPKRRREEREEAEDNGERSE